MAPNYLIDLFEDSLVKLAKLETVDSVDQTLLMMKLTTQLKQARETHNSGDDEEFKESRECLALMGQVAEKIDALSDTIHPPGLFLTTFNLMEVALTIQIMAKQDADPVIRAQMDAIRAKAEVDALPKLTPDPVDPSTPTLDILRQGFTGGSVTPDLIAPNPVEKVVVVMRTMVESAMGMPGGIINGFFTPNGGEVSELNLLKRYMITLNRPVAEQSPLWKQIVIYAVVVHNGKVLSYTRGKVGAEARLHAKHSIGVGGHMEPQDFASNRRNTGDYYMNALMRELREEVGILPSHIASVTHLGFVNNEQDPVGQVHLGVVYIVDLDGIDGIEFEKAMLNPRWVNVPLGGIGVELEAWSEMILTPISRELSNGLIREEQTREIRYSPKRPDFSGSLSKTDENGKRSYVPTDRAVDDGVHAVNRESGFDEDLGELDPKAACKTNEPGCESCQ